MPQAVRSPRSVSAVGPSGGTRPGTTRGVSLRLLTYSRRNSANGGGVLTNQYQQPKLRPAPNAIVGTGNHVEQQYHQSEYAEPHEALGRGVSAPGGGNHHYDAHPAPDDRREHCVGSVEAVQRRDEPEQPGAGELALPGKLTKLNDERYEDGLADPLIDFRKKYVQLLSVSRGDTDVHLALF